jgi:hypothetical protein
MRKVTICALEVCLLEFTRLWKVVHIATDASGAPLLNIYVSLP